MKLGRRVHGGVAIGTPAEAGISLNHFEHAKNSQHPNSVNVHLSFYSCISLQQPKFLINFGLEGGQEIAETWKAHPLYFETLVSKDTSCRASRTSCTGVHLVELQ
jgi:hypothetical protein